MAALAVQNKDAPVIELNGLTVRLGKREILHELKGTLRGGTIGLLGPNGAGKSTMIQTLLGFIQPTAGSAAIFGRDIRKDARGLRSMIGYMPENDSFIADMTAVAFVRMMGELSGLPSEAALERAHEVLFYVGLGEARYRPLGTYSLGMKQLAKLAQAIVHGPRLVILDEPTNGLDPPARLRMIRLIKEMRDTGKMHLVVCSHLLRDVEETCEQRAHEASRRRDRAREVGPVEVVGREHARIWQDRSTVTNGLREAREALENDVARRGTHHRAEVGRRAPVEERRRVRPKRVTPLFLREHADRRQVVAQDADATLFGAAVRGKVPRRIHSAPDRGEDIELDRRLHRRGTIVRGEEIEHRLQAHAWILLRCAVDGRGGHEPRGQVADLRMRPRESSTKR